MISFNTSLNALNAFSFGVGVTANNLANVATPGFKASETLYAALPEFNGVRVEAIRPNNNGGPLMPYGPGLPPKPASDTAPEGFIEGSNTDVAREMVNLIALERAYQANTKPITIQDELLGFLVNLKA